MKIEVTVKKLTKEEAERTVRRTKVGRILKVVALCASLYLDGKIIHKLEEYIESVD